MAILYPTNLVFQPIIAQTTESPQPPQPPPSGEKTSLLSNIWMLTTIGFAVIAVALVVYGKMQLEKKDKEIKFEHYKAKDLQKRLKLALKTIQKMERNPDLVHSREFNLDYLRLRMEEEVFHYAIVNQIKIRVKQLISVALRPSTNQSTVGVANTSGRQIDETFDVVYETETQGQKKPTKRVLFRIQVKLTKLPTQSSSETIRQIISCLEKFLSPDDEHENWQPTIQGRVVIIRWDQKAKPTPLLVLEQSSEGGNVTIRSNPSVRPETPPSHPKARTQKTVSKQSQGQGKKSSSKRPSSGNSKGRPPRPPQPPRRSSSVTKARK